MHASTRQYRTFLRDYLLPEWRRVVVVGVLLLCTIALQLSGPQILRSFIDLASSGAPSAQLTVIALLYLAVALSSQLLAVAETYVAENLGWLATNRLRASLMLHCLHLDPGFYQAHTPGALIERIDGDATTLGNFFSRFVVYILGNAILLAGIIIMLFRIDWRIGCAILIFTACSIILMNRVRTVAVPHWATARQASADLMGFIEERIAGMEDIRANGAETYVMRRLYERSRALLRSTQRASVYGSSLGGVMNLLFALGTALALTVAIYLFDGSLITLGTVYLIFSYTQMLERPIEEMTRQLQDLQQAGAGIARVTQLLETRTRLIDGTQGTRTCGPLSLSFEHVSFGYDPDEPILRDVSFTVGEGQVLGVLGRTGSGKTTISRLVFRLHDPDNGVVYLDGTDLRTQRLSALRSRIGLVTQDIHLFHASVRDNLTFFDDSIPDEHIESVLTDLGLREWCQGLSQGLDTPLAPGSAGLSAGESQLLAFARVFLQDPGIVILDEASSRLDPATEFRIERAVDRLLHDRTGIVIAHRLGTVQRADDILVLEAGEVLEYGARTVLAANPTSRFAGLLRRGLEVSA